MASAFQTERVMLMRESLLRLTGRDMFVGLDIGDDPAQAVFDAPFALVSHDTSPDPVFVYGNALALRLFEMSWDDFTSLPSRLSAEPVARSERDRLLSRVASENYIDDYSGVRISATGKRFVINEAVVWNLIDDSGIYRGQAAMFEHYTPIDDAMSVPATEPTTVAPPALAPLLAPTFRPLTRPELDVALEWAAGEGWNPGPDDADAFWDTDPEGFWAILLDDTLVGTASAVVYDPLHGFCGLFIVRPEYRHHGIGAAAAPFLMDKIRERLDPGASIGIDGVFAMQHFYASLGFEFTHRNLRMAGVGKPSDHRGRSDGLQALSSLDFDDVLAYDAAHFGVARPSFLRHWIDPVGGLGLASVYDGTLQGIGVIRPCESGYKVGPLFADRPDVAQEIFRALSDHAAGQPLYLDVPECNPDAVALAARHHMTEVFGCARMVMGPIPPTRWDRIFGVTTFELG